MWQSRFLVVLILCAVCAAAEAQQPKKVPAIGYLSSGTRLGASGEAFGEGLAGLGYVEGKNITIERRFAEGKLDRLPELVAELIAVNFRQR